MSDDKKPTDADVAIGLLLMAMLGIALLSLTLFAGRCAWTMGGAM